MPIAALRIAAHVLVFSAQNSPDKCLHFNSLDSLISFDGKTHLEKRSC